MIFTGFMVKSGFAGCGGSLVKVASANITPAEAKGRHAG